VIIKVMMTREERISIKYREERKEIRMNMNSDTME
jgi:hypothetical protein